MWGFSHFLILVGIELIFIYLVLIVHFRGLYHKIYYGRKLRISVISFKPFQPSLVFVDKARSLPYSGAPERCFTWVGLGMARGLLIGKTFGKTLQIRYVQ
jgi:hypothetical protein